MSRLTSRPSWRVLLALGVGLVLTPALAPPDAAAVVGAGLPASVQTADEAAAWSAAPADAAGLPDGRTRFELEVAPGTPVLENVLITNSSTVERVFTVYGADGFNTPSGGYDLEAAAVTPVDVGLWVTVATPTVTIPPLSTAVVGLTVTVPEGAAPGDHPGGVVVSPVQAQVTEAGVVVDTRVAVRLNVRVPGELAPALDVRQVSATFGRELMPFAPAPATVTYEVVNTGNVKIIGVPRVRLAGPFGMRLADVEGDETREVLPGESFTVTSVLEGVAPVGLATAVVDVDMKAAPGPATEIPLVSSTARATVLVVSWTGLAVVLLVALGAVVVVRRRVRRRRSGVALWETMLEDARRDASVTTAAQVSRGAAPRPGAAAALTLVGALAAGGLVLAPVPAQAAEPDRPAALASTGTLPTTGSVVGTDAPARAGVLLAEEEDSGALRLTVPRPAATPTPTPSPTAAPPAGAGVPGGTTTGSVGRPRGTTSAGTVVDGVVEPTSPDPDGSALDVDPPGSAGPAPDLVWSASGGERSVAQWTVIGLGATAGTGVLAFAARALLLARRPGGVA